MYTLEDDQETSSSLRQRDIVNAQNTQQTQGAQDTTGATDAANAIDAVDEIETPNMQTLPIGEGIAGIAGIAGIGTASTAHYSCSTVFTTTDNQFFQAAYYTREGVSGPQGCRLRGPLHCLYQCFLYGDGSDGGGHGIATDDQ